MSHFLSCYISIENWFFSSVYHSRELFDKTFMVWKKFSYIYSFFIHYLILEYGYYTAQQDIDDVWLISNGTCMPRNVDKLPQHMKASIHLLNLLSLKWLPKAWVYCHDCPNIFFFFFFSTDLLFKSNDVFFLCTELHSCQAMLWNFVLEVRKNVSYGLICNYCLFLFKCCSCLGSNSSRS